MRRKKRTELLVAAGLATLSSAYAWWYIYRVCRNPRVLVADGRLKRILEKGVPNIWKPYRPTPWLTHTHLQTVAGVIRRIGGQVYERELLTAEDGGTVGLDWFKNSDDYTEWKEATPIVMVMHGITGGSQEGYCRWMCTAAYNNGWRSVVFCYRGCAGLPLTSPKGYCAAITDDVHLVIDHIKAKYPRAPLFVASYSLGSLMLCKYLGETDADVDEGGKGSQVEAAALVSCPCCMFTSGRTISKPWSIPWLFNLILTYRLKMYAHEHHEQFTSHPGVDHEAVRRSMTLRDFEEATVMQVFGLPSMDEYYKQGSTHTHIPNIRTNTMILVADDDPFVGDTPVEECKRNPHTALVSTAHGGHCAFLQGVWPFGQAWMEDTLMQFFKACHEDAPSLHKGKLTRNGFVLSSLFLC